MMAHGPIITYRAVHEEPLSLREAVASVAIGALMGPYLTAFAAMVYTGVMPLRSRELANVVAILVGGASFVGWLAFAATVDLFVESWRNWKAGRAPEVVQATREREG